MIGDEILNLVAERFGRGPVSTAYYSKIKEWDSWWRGYNRPFHEFTENTTGGTPIHRQLYRMNMAKKICEDWATLLLNDTVRISVDDEQGETFVAKQFAANDFIGQANRMTERAFALGTGAVILRLSGDIDENGSILPDGCALSFEWVDAEHIIPISVQNGVITEAAFVSEGIRRGKEYLYLESHILESDGYVIRNEFFCREDGELVESADETCAREIHTHSAIPMFSILMPNLQNNVDPYCGLGLSVYADAIDCLKGVDLAFNNFCRDIKLGGKKVFINQSLVSKDEYGNIFTPDDVAQQLFVTLGDTDFSDHTMITEHNPELRTHENTSAVQAQLNYLSFRCGLGTHHYTFDHAEAQAKMTATQYMGERQDMRQNVAKHQKTVRRFLIGVVRALLWVASEIYALPVNPCASVTVSFDDSYFTDSESQRARDLRELEAGVLSVDEYRRKWIEGDENG